MQQDDDAVVYELTGMLERLEKLHEELSSETRKVHELRTTHLRIIVRRDEDPVGLLMDQVREALSDVMLIATKGAMQLGRVCTPTKAEGKIPSPKKQIKSPWRKIPSPKNFFKRSKSPNKGSSSPLPSPPTLAATCSCQVTPAKDRRKASPMFPTVDVRSAYYQSLEALPVADDTPVGPTPAPATPARQVTVDIMPGAALVTVPAN